MLTQALATHSTPKILEYDLEPTQLILLIPTALSGSFACNSISDAGAAFLADILRTNNTLKDLRQERMLSYLVVLKISLSAFTLIPSRIMVRSC